MFPLRDENPTLHKSVVTFSLITLNVLAWIFLQGAGLPGPLLASFARFGAIPAELFGLAPAGSEIVLGHWAFRLEDSPRWYTVLTSMFMHGGWFHLISNMWFLAVFGDNVEDVMGPVRFLLFYLLCGVAAFFTQALTAPSSTVPMVGASGAVSGVLGAYFFLFPAAPVYTLVFFGWLWTVVFPAWFLIGYWFFLQVLAGLPALANPSGGIAFWAHIGGFLSGLLLVRVFADPCRIRPCREARGRVRRFLTPYDRRNPPSFPFDDPE